MEYSILVNYLISLFGNYPILISFFAGLFGGELTLISLGFIAETGYITLWNIIIFTTLGLIISDTVLFLIGRIHYVRNIKQLERFSPHFKKIDSFIIKLSRNNLFLVIFYAKFIYGASIPTLIYLGMKKTSTSKFVFYISVVNMFFLTLFIVIGVLWAKGFFFIIDYFRNIQLAFSLLVLIIILLFIVKKWLKTKLISKK